MPERIQYKPFPISEAERIRKQKLKDKSKREEELKYTDGLF